MTLAEAVPRMQPRHRRELRHLVHLWQTVRRQLAQTVFESESDQQRHDELLQYARRIALRLKWLKDDIALGESGRIHGYPIELIEPRLAPPRSALNPAILKRIGMLEDGLEASHE